MEISAVSDLLHEGSSLGKICAGVQVFDSKSIVDDNAKSVHDGCMVRMVEDGELQGANMKDIRQSIPPTLVRPWSKR